VKAFCACAGALLALSGLQAARAGNPAELIGAEVRRALEQTDNMPAREELYARTVAVSHNWDVPREQSRADFVHELTVEVPVLKSTLGSATITRFLVAGDTVVVTVRFARGAPRGESPPQIAYFVKIHDGMIVGEQVFADREQLALLFCAMGEGSGCQAGTRKSGGADIGCAAAKPDDGSADDIPRAMHVMLEDKRDEQSLRTSRG